MCTRQMAAEMDKEIKDAVEEVKNKYEETIEELIQSNKQELQDAVNIHNLQLNELNQKIENLEMVSRKNI